MNNIESSELAIKNYINKEYEPLSLEKEIQKNDLATIKSLADQFPEKFREALTIKDGTGKTPIHRAIIDENLKFLDLLMKKLPEEFEKIAIIPDENGTTLFSFAVANQRLNSMQFLIEEFPTRFTTASTFRNKQGNTLFHLAVKRNDFEMLKLLERNSPEGFKNALTIENEKKETFLHLAVSLTAILNQIEMLSFIVEKAPIEILKKINIPLNSEIVKLFNNRLFSPEHPQYKSEEEKMMEEVLDGILQNSSSLKLDRKDLTFLLKKAIENQQQVTIDHETYLVEFEKGTRKFEILHLEAVFAKGGRGEVRKAINCFNSTVEVLKQAIAAKGEEANVTIKKEYHLLISIHEHGKCWGIQAPPRKLVSLANIGDPEQDGFLGVYYEGTYSQVTISNLQDCFWQFHQLLAGLMVLDKKEILHGDLKLENILFKRNQDGSLLIHIADMGDAVRVTYQTQNSELLSYGGPRGHTKAYSPLQDLELAREFYKQSNRAGLIRVEKQRDVFAIGSIMYRKLQAHRPYNYDKHGYPQVYDPLQPITRLPTPQNLERLIQDMLHPNYLSRPSGSEAFDRFNNIFSRELPDFYKQTQDKMGAEYPGTRKIQSDLY